MPEITREEAKRLLENALFNAESDARARPQDDVFCAAKDREAACLRLALAALEDAERWAPKPRERYVRVADELVEQLRAAPSEPVTLQIRDEPDGTLMFVCTSAAIDRARGV